MYFPQEPAIQIHQIRVYPCPVAFPPGYYWYGRKQHSPGPPSWVENLIESCVSVEPEAELADGAVRSSQYLKQKRMYSSRTATIYSPNCDNIDPDMWASEFEVVDSRRADLSTTVSPPEMKGGSRNAKTKYSLRHRVEPPKRLYGPSLEKSSN